MKNFKYKNPFERIAQKSVAFCVCVALAGSLFSCGEKAEEGGGVPFVACPCDEYDAPLGNVKGVARLFFDEVFWSVPMDSERIVFRSATSEHTDIVKLALDDPRFRTPSGGWVFVDICNFPDFAKEWNVPGGVTVYYEGTLYPWCDILGILCRGTGPCYSMILTKLKIR